MSLSLESKEISSWWLTKENKKRLAVAFNFGFI